MNSKIATIVQQLDARGQRQPLMPTSAWSPELEAEIRELDWRGRDRETAVIALMAGLHLCNDSLDASHRFAQQIEFDSTGAYWHGLMHRMEGDFSNGKYWFYQAGKHPAMQDCARQIPLALRDGFDEEDAPAGKIRQLLLDFRDKDGWSPAAFTDLVQWQHGREISPAMLRVLEHMQCIEARTLLRYTLEACAPLIDSLADR